MIKLLIQDEVNDATVTRTRFDVFSQIQENTVTQAARLRWFCSSLRV